MATFDDDLVTTRDAVADYVTDDEDLNAAILAGEFDDLITDALNEGWIDAEIAVEARDLWAEGRDV